MKKTILAAIIGVATLSMTSCGNNLESKTHTHDDGSTHADHDTTKPKQEEFTVSDTTHSDTTSHEHTHEGGEKHSH
jgi:ABC-type nickel/cobalt efflux system permease component RcnA